jgi:hypothetical protein
LITGGDKGRYFSTALSRESHKREAMEKVAMPYYCDISDHDRDRAHRACLYLQQAGFIVLPIQEFGKSLLIECYKPSKGKTATAANYEKLIDKDVRLARKCLLKTKLKIKPWIFGWRIVFHLPASPEGRRVGRPRKDALRSEVLELRKQNMSWNRIAGVLNTRTGADRTPGAYRILVQKPH